MRPGFSKGWAVILILCFGFLSLSCHHRAVRRTVQDVVSLDPDLHDPALHKVEKFSQKRKDLLAAEIAPYLRSVNPHVRRQAALALEAAGDGVLLPVIDNLLAELKNPDAAVRWRAVMGLGSLQSHQDKIRPELEKMRQDPDIRVQRALQGAGLDF